MSVEIEKNVPEVYANIGSQSRQVRALERGTRPGHGSGWPWRTAKRREDAGSNAARYYVPPVNLFDKGHKDNQQTTPEGVVRFYKERNQWSPNGTHGLAMSAVRVNTGGRASFNQPRTKPVERKSWLY